MKIRNFASGDVFMRNTLLTGVCFFTLVITMTISLLNGLATGIFVTCAVVASLLMRWLISLFVDEQWHLALYALSVCAIVSLGEFASMALYPEFASRMAFYLPITAIYCLSDRSFDFTVKPFHATLQTTVLNCVGFSAVCLAIGAVRELLAFGTLLGIPVIKDYLKMPAMVLPIGGMIVFAFGLAFINFIRGKGGKL